MSKTISITATVFDSIAQEERFGWVELNWDRFSLNDKEEGVESHELPEGVTPKEFIESLIGNVVEGANGTYYAENTVDGPDDTEWTYAAHLKDAT